MGNMENMEDEWNKKTRMSSIINFAECSFSKKLEQNTKDKIFYYFEKSFVLDFLIFFNVKWLLINLNTFFCNPTCLFWWKRLINTPFPLVKRVSFRADALVDDPLCLNWTVLSSNFTMHLTGLINSTSLQDSWLALGQNKSQNAVINMG